MSNAFRELLKKIGSGPHTGKNLCRAEARAAMAMMLTQEATPAQIGGFLLAHRIRRPTGEELAGMLDAYDILGPQVPEIDSPNSVSVLGIPYDGRSRTFPLGIAITLALAAADYPVLLHGGTRMPTKYGIPLVEMWLELGLDWRSLALTEVHHHLQTQGIGFVYLPKHFPLAHGLVQYRDEIGKRPPLATLELMWSPYAGKNQQVIAGFVHPPTETMMREACALRGLDTFMTIKGQEGSGDLPLDRTSLLGVNRGASWERLKLRSREYGLKGANIPLPEDREILREQLIETLQGKPNAIQPHLIWNVGVYLWLLKACPTLDKALELGRSLITAGAAWDKLTALKTSLTAAC
ncbi:MAG: hypothetical protein AAGF75_10955 [Cyanobacteria bacterium P01_H01_bin.130]